jgi:WD40 repeat protein
VASGSSNKTVRLWDSAIGAAYSTLKSYTSYIGSITFLLDGKLITSSSSNKTVQLWDSAIGVVYSTLKGYTNWVYSITFLLDGKLIASSSGNKTIKIWDSVIGTIWLWDLAIGAARNTLKGHTGSV